MTETIMTPVSPGELIDKITILRIKSEQIKDTVKLQNVTTELNYLNEVRNAGVPDTEQIRDLDKKLQDVNQSLWNIEDDIRDCERASDFGEEFIRLARAVYHENDKRAALKKEINIALGSKIVEEKSYAAY